jgi:cation transport ATPase
MAETIYTVTGMTCGHCVSSVTEELAALEGVTDVSGRHGRRGDRRRCRSPRQCGRRTRC